MLRDVYFMNNVCVFAISSSAEKEKCLIASGQCAKLESVITGLLDKNKGEDLAGKVSELLFKLNEHSAGNSLSK
jgi:hypothetical protein